MFLDGGEATDSTKINIVVVVNFEVLS